MDLKGPGHWLPPGHRAVAEAIHEYLASNGDLVSESGNGTRSSVVIRSTKRSTKPK
jgi:hypothetical protein